MVFGSRLEEHLATEQYSETLILNLKSESGKTVEIHTRIPGIIKRCAEHILKNGIENQGIFRITGAASKVRELRALCEREFGRTMMFPDWAMPQDVATLMKSFLRELQEPLIPEKLSKVLLKTSGMLPLYHCL